MFIKVRPTWILNPVKSTILNAVAFRIMSTKNYSVNFNSRHLKTGDALPPWNGKLRLYNMRYCPFAHRAVLTLIAKNVDFEIVNIDLINRPTWLNSKSELGKVPALEISENECLVESLIVSEYLDEVFPQRPLLPKDPFEKAKVKFITQMSDSIHSIFFRALRGLEINDNIVDNYNRSLRFIDDELKKRGNFLHGIEPGFADYMLWPWFERNSAGVELDERIAIDEEKYPNILKYIENMENDPVVKEYRIPSDIQKQYIRNYSKGIIDYELLNK